MRFTSEEAFNHPWIQRQRTRDDSQAIISGDVLTNMRGYIETINFKRTTLTLIASRIPEDQIKALREAFGKFDKNGDGRLTIAELKEGVKLVKGGVGLSDDDLEKAMSVLDSNKNGYIDYTEFIAACLQSYNYLNENHLKTAFSYFDKDSSGTISLEELS